MFLVPSIATTQSFACNRYYTNKFITELNVLVDTWVLKIKLLNYEYYEGKGGKEGDKEVEEDPGVRPGKGFCVLVESKW